MDNTLGEPSIEGKSRETYERTYGMLKLCMPSETQEFIHSPWRPSSSGSLSFMSVPFLWSHTLCARRLTSFMAVLNGTGNWVKSLISLSISRVYLFPSDRDFPEHVLFVRKTPFTVIHCHPSPFSSFYHSYFTLSGSYKIFKWTGTPVVEFRRVMFEIAYVWFILSS